MAKIGWRWALATVGLLVGEAKATAPVGLQPGEPGFTIRLDVDLDGVKGGERLYEIPGCLTLDLRMAGEDPKLKTYDTRDSNYLPFRLPDGTCPVLEAHMPSVEASRVGLPLGFLGGTGGVRRVVLNYAKTHFSIAVDGHMDDDMLLQPCPPADPAKAKILSSRVKKADFTTPADSDALPLVKDARPIAGSVQYWTPADHNAWVGDVALGFFKGRLHVFYLYDRRHHASKAWKGGHFFAHISSADLVHWEEHPHAVPIENWWETLGTGTPFEYDGKLHLAYGLHTSRITKDPQYPMGATYAVSEDGIHFTKSGRIIHETQNPTIFNRADGTLGLVVGYGGMGGFWTSRNLDNWKLFDDKVPTKGDCPCPFEWNGHHYLFQGFNQFAYSPSGKPGTYVDWTKNGLAPYEGLSVPMVAPFTGNRRILAGWLSHRDGWGGWLVFRELIQYPDGTLGQKWVPEIAPPVAPQTFTAQPNEPFRLVFRPASGTGPALVFAIDPAAREAAFRDETSEVPWGDACNAGNFKIRRLPAFVSPYAVRVVSYYDRKSEDTIFDVEIGGARTMICRRKGRFRAPEEYVVQMTVDPAKVQAEVPKTLYGIGMEDVNHEIYGGLDAQRLFGESFEEPTRSDTAAGPSRMWFLSEAEAGGCTYWQTNRWHWGRASQQLVPGGGVVAIANRGLNAWGVPVRKGRKMVGSLWAWGRVDRLTVGLQDRDGARTYAATELTLDAATDGWRRLGFALVPDATDANAQFFVRASGAGSVWIDDAYLADEPTDAFGRLGCRADIAAAFRPMGVTFLRWGGTMANAPGYRLRNMPGTGERPPYDGFWYKWASGGFGVREFVRLAAELKVPCAFSISADEDVTDAVAFAQELTAYRIPLYVQIGNEEGLPWFKQDTPDFYRAYVEKVRRLVPPMRAANPALKFVSAAYWRDDAPELMKIAFDGTDGLVDYWDVHVSTKSVAAARESAQELKRALARLRAWNPQTTMRLAVFEENAHHHRHERALAHAALLAGARELGDDLLTSCPVNALQPDLQNDNGWDQGMIFFTPDKVWLQSYGWAHQMAAANHRDRLVASTCADTNVVVSATRDRDGTSVVLHVVNAVGEPKPLALAGLDGYRLVRATTLASDDPNLDNPARVPDRIVPTDLTVAFAANAILPPFSYTVLVYEKGAAARVLGPAVRVHGVSDWAMGVCLDGTTLYAVAGGVLSAFDVREPLKPKLLGQLSGMDNNRQVVAQDGFVYVVSRETGMRIIDARDPKNMRLRSRYDSVEFATGIDVVGKTAFLSERIYGVEVVDVSDPDNPAHICIRKTGESQSNRYRDGYLYSGEWGGAAVEVFDAHDLKTFRPIGKLQLGGFGDGLEIDGDYLYCSTGHDAKHHRAKAVKDRHGAGRGLDIFSLADPAKPKWVSRVDFPVFTPRNEDFWTPRVANGLAFCCDSHNGLFVVDVKDPTQPKVVDRFCVPQKRKEDWPSGAISSCAIGEGCVYVTSFPGGLWVLTVAGVKPPARPKGTPPAHPNYREPYPTDTAAFHVYRPAVAGQARTVVLRGDIAYAAFGDAGLHVLRLSETGFEKLGTLPGGRRVTDCCFVGDRLVTAEGVDGFAVYELNGPTGFREIARRAASSRADRSVAFWCWPTTDDKVILTARCGPYELYDVTDFGAAHPILSFPGTCLWDKYPADGTIDGRFPVLKPYNGLGWLDFTGPMPRFENQEKAATAPFFGSQNDGICRLGANRFLYTIQQPQSSVYDYGAAAYYVLVEADGTYSKPLALPPVPAFGKGRDARFSGIPRADGNLVLMTNRSGRKAVVWDFAEPERPKVLRAYTLFGNPDLGTFFHGKAVIPAGHQGLVMER